MPPLFPASVEQVVVDAVVLDEQGAGVTGLSRDDFLLAEDGKPQAIASFEAVEAQAPPAGVQPEASRGRVVTNAAPTFRAERRTIVIVFDDLGLSLPQGERARAAVADFVRTEIAAGDRLSLSSTSGRERWVARTQEEIEDLLDVLARLRGLAVSDSSVEPMTDAEACRIHVERDPRTTATVTDRYLASGVTMGQAVRHLVSADAAATCQRASTRARQILAALEHSTRSLHGVRGRKAVILVSPGFLYNPGIPEYRRILEACRVANVAVYFLDVAGLAATATSLAAPPVSLFRAPDVQRPPAETGTEQEALARAFPARDSDVTAGAESVAHETGGFVVRNTNDLAGGLRRVAQDTRAYYLLGYVSTNAARDGRYRRITVRLSPRAGAGREHWKVRARRGYDAPTGAELARTSSRAEEELLRVLDSPVDRRDVPLRLAAYTLEDSPETPGRVHCLLVAEVGSAALTLPHARGRAEDAGLDVAYEALPRGEGRAERRLKRVKLSAQESLTRDWIGVGQELELAPGVYRVVVAVRDVPSSRSGSVSVRLDVPPTGGFRVSTPFVWASGEAESTGRPRSTPAGDREFASTDRVEVTFAVYGALRDPGSGQPRLSAAYAVVPASDGAALRARFTPLAFGGTDPLHRLVGFGLAGVAPGPYLFVGRVVDELTGRQVTFAEPFAVVPAPEHRTVVAPTPRAASDPGLDALLERAGRYVVEYENALHDLAAAEEYSQRAPAWDPRQPDWRRTRADVVFVRLAPPFPWATFRDVYEVNGAAVRDRDLRLQQAFRGSPGTAVARAEALLEESARHNIGPERTVNLPTLPLLFLHPANQGRFAFERKGRGGGGTGVELAFREQTRPTVIREFRESRPKLDAAVPRVPQSGDDLPAEGRFWIDPRRGTVLRSEVRFRFAFDATATITTTYRAEPSLAMWVPVEMKERYEGGEFGVGTDAVARYSRFRKFEVTVEQGDVRVTPP